MRTLTLTVCIISAAFLLAGCGGDESAKTDKPDQPTKPAVTTEVNVEKADLTGLMEIIEAERTRPLVVNLFATWCSEFCTPEFPILAALHGKLSGKVDMVGVSFDFIEKKEDDHADVDAAVDCVRERMPKFGISYPLIVVDNGGQGWGGICSYFEVEQDIPVTILYAADGTRLGHHKPFTSAAEAVAWIEKLTAK
jgi:hypothetical protein